MVCMNCLKKQQRINELEEEIVGLKAKLRYQERTAEEGPFKSSTPSSKIPIKPSSLPERQAKKGGAKPGHLGHGRSAVTPDQADREEIVPMDRLCPQCQEEMRYKGTKPRSVIDYTRGRVDRSIYQQEVCQCPRCKKIYTARPKGVLPKSHYGNGLLTHVAVEHYLYGRTMGQLESQLGIGYGSQSDRGSNTLEVLMTVLQTLKKRGQDVYAVFKSALDRIASDATVEPYAILFESNSS